MNAPVGRVHILDETLANQIAAGEVVERPASVAKELLENAVDAGASAITVEIADGGVSLLRVVDDGHGMGREDARLALQRHATSKLSEAKDLHRILTLGFRGEALPSIASVSRFQLRTREPEMLGGTGVRVEGGGSPEVIDVGGPPGTEVMVRDLFFNVPARRKFLKKPSTEAAHVLEAVQRLAMCYPGVAFRLVRDGRTTLELPRHGTLGDRVRALFGERQTSNLRPLRRDGPFAVDGLLGPPDEARATARHYHTFVNGRFVRDRVVMGAVRSAYGVRLARGRHPFVVLRISMPPEAVDVNVHPAKTEVRFADSRTIHRLVAGAIDDVLSQEPWAPPDTPPTRAYTLRVPAPSGAEGGGGEARVSDLPGADAHRRRVRDAMRRLGSGGEPRHVPRPVHERGSAGPGAEVDAAAGPAQSALALAPGPSDGQSTRSALGTHPSLGTLPFDGLEVLGTVGSLLLLAAEDGLVGVDLPAARVRVAYDALRRSPGGVAAPTALSVDLSPEEAGALDRSREALGAFGWSLEPFGGSAWVVQRVPAGLPAPRIEAALRACLAAPAEEAALRCAQVTSAGPLPASERKGLLSALARLEHTPPRPTPFAFALTEPELRRALRAE